MTINQNTIDNFIRIALIALIVAWSVMIVAPFVGILLWGIIIAISAYPAFAWAADPPGVVGPSSLPQNLSRRLADSSVSASRACSLAPAGHPWLFVNPRAIEPQCRIESEESPEKAVCGDCAKDRKMSVQEGAAPEAVHDHQERVDCCAHADRSAVIMRPDLHVST